MGRLVGAGEASRVLALEYMEAVRLAAQLDARVVLGERDLLTTISRCVARNHLR